MTFLPYARKILSAAQEAREALRRAERGRVSLAMPNWPHYLQMAQRG